MKKYTTPEMQVTRFDERDMVLTLSGANTPETISTWGSRVDSVEFNVFE